MGACNGKQSNATTPTNLKRPPPNSKRPKKNGIESGEPKLAQKPVKINKVPISPTAAAPAVVPANAMPTVNLIDPSDFATVVDERMSDVVNLLSPTEIQQIVRKLRHFSAKKGLDESALKKFLGLENGWNKLVSNIFAYISLFGDSPIQIAMEQNAGENVSKEASLSSTLTTYQACFLFALALKSTSKRQKSLLMYHALLPAKMSYQFYCGRRRIPLEVLEDGYDIQFTSKKSLPELPPISTPFFECSQPMTFSQFYKSNIDVTSFFQKVFCNVLMTPAQESQYVKAKSQSFASDQSNSAEEATTTTREDVYLIEAKWYAHWCKYSGLHGIPNAKPIPRPNSIPNHLLLQPNSNQLKPQLAHSEFKLINKNHYRALLELFGGGPEICRPVVEGDVVLKDVWTLEGNLCDPQQPYRRGPCISTQSIHVLTAAHAPLADVVMRLVSLLATVPLTPDLKLRIWHTTSQTNKYTLLLPGHLKYETSTSKFQDAVATYTKNLTVKASSLSSSSRLLLEYNGSANSSWPRTVVQRDEFFESWLRDLCRVCAESADLESIATLSNGQIAPYNNSTPSSALRGIWVDALDHAGRWWRVEVLRTAHKLVYEDEEESVEGPHIQVEFKRLNSNNSDEEWILLTQQTDRVAMLGTYTVGNGNAGDG